MVLIGALPQEHERALGAWHAEWPALSGALAFAGGAAEAARRALDGLEVDVDRMRANLELAGGLVMAEQASFLLTEKLGRRGAQELVAEAAERSRASGRSLRDELGAELEVGLDPVDYLGSANAFVDRVLSFYRDELGDRA
jgi:3-carboxy-cis,cis-muconate cycloisomerase